MMLTSEKQKSNSEDKCQTFEIMNDRGILASYLLFILSKITNLDHIGQSKLVKDPSTNKSQ